MGGRRDRGVVSVKEIASRLLGVTSSAGGSQDWEHLPAIRCMFAIRPRPLMMKAGGNGRRCVGIILTSSFNQLVD